MSFQTCMTDNLPLQWAVKRCNVDSRTLFVNESLRPVLWTKSTNSLERSDSKECLVTNRTSLLFTNAQRRGLNSDYIFFFLASKDLQYSAWVIWTLLWFFCGAYNSPHSFSLYGRMWTRYCSKIHLLCHTEDRKSSDLDRYEGKCWQNFNF